MLHPESATGYLKALICRPPMFAWLFLARNPPAASSSSSSSSTGLIWQINRGLSGAERAGGLFISHRTGPAGAYVYVCVCMCTHIVYEYTYVATRRSISRKERSIKLEAIGGTTRVREGRKARDGAFNTLRGAAKSS